MFNTRLILWWVGHSQLTLSGSRLKNNNYAEMIFDRTTGTGCLSPATLRDIILYSNLLECNSRLHAC